MEQKELTQHLEFEYWGYYAAERNDAEQHHLPFKPMTLEKFTQGRQAMVDDSLDRLPRLKPCPFCERTVTLSARHRWWFVGCECGARGPEFEIEHLAVMGWNKMCRREP